MCTRNVFDLAAESSPDLGEVEELVSARPPHHLPDIITEACRQHNTKGSESEGYRSRLSASRTGPRSSKPHMVFRLWVAVSVAVSAAPRTTRDTPDKTDTGPKDKRDKTENRENKASAHAPCWSGSRWES
eukprot:3442901-Rhodomonas_salina.2